MKLKKFATKRKSFTNNNKNNYRQTIDFPGTRGSVSRDTIEITSFAEGFAIRQLKAPLPSAR